MITTPEFAMLYVIIAQSVIIGCLLKDRRHYKIGLEIYEDYVEQLKTRLRGSTPPDEK